MPMRVNSTVDLCWHRQCVFGLNLPFVDAAYNVYCRCGTELRLVSSTPREGRLEIFHNGSWGTVCNDAFNDVDAQVACFSLGFGLLTIC